MFTGVYRMLVKLFEKTSSHQLQQRNVEKKLRSLAKGYTDKEADEEPRYSSGAFSL